MASPSFFNNEQADLAFQYVQCTDQHLFLTGKAGTGKTTFLKNLREQSPKRMIVVAPTGVAAINAEGVTIHSFFSLPFSPFVPKEARVDNGSNQFHRFSRVKIDIIRSLDLLVIDEISMVRADVLDAIDEVLRRYKNRNKPFGGVQLLMIGDLQQLPPVVTDADVEILKDYYDTYFFYGSRALRNTRFVTIELQHIYRQSDSRFIDLLNAVRDNRLTREVFDLLGQRTIPGFESDDHIMLTTHNYQSQKVNDARLKGLKNASYFFKAKVSGDFPESAYPTDAQLELKIGARVMFLKNDPEKAFYNGKIGVVTAIQNESIYVKGEGDDVTIAVRPMEWNNMQYGIDEKTQDIVETVIGTFEQYPLKLAWAITIHKSQGLTFDRVVIDARAAFAHGQVYVALSRCRTLDGLVLSTPVLQSSLVNSSEIEQFIKQQNENTPTPESLKAAQQYYMQELLLDLFDFTPLHRAIVDITYRLKDNEQIVSGNVFSSIRSIKDSVNQDIVSVGVKFHSQLNELIAQNGNVTENQLLQERIRKGAAFFCEKILHLLIEQVEMLSYETDNKTVKKSIKEGIDRLLEKTYLKKACLEACVNGFELSHYLSVRAKISIANDQQSVKSGEKQTGKIASKHPELLLKLRSWRNATATELNIEPYEVLRQKSIDEIVAFLPTNSRALSAIKGLGAKRVRQFGTELLEIILEYMQEKGLVISTEEPAEEKKQNTYEKTYELFSKGLSIEAIAQERALGITTIEGHLARFVKDGTITIETIMPLETVERISDYFKTAEIHNLTPAYEALGGQVSYGELRCVLNHLYYKGELVPPIND